MARIRSIRPETWSDHRFVALSLAARLLYIALWNYADDYGCGEYLPKRIAGFAFPLDDIDAAPLLDELVALVRIVKYEVDGETYFCIPSWDKHQKPQNPGKRRIPAPPDAIIESSLVPTETLIRPSSDPTPLDRGDGSLEVKKKGPAFPKEQTRPMFAAFVEIFGTPTRPMKAAYGKTVNDALDAGIEPSEVGPAARRYKERWPGAACTPMALVKHWNTFGPEAHLLSLPAEVREAYLPGGVLHDRVSGV